MPIRFGTRLIVLARAIANPFAVHPAVNDGSPVALAATHDGVLYTQSVVGGPGGISSSVPGTLSATSNPGVGVKASASIPADGSGNNAKNILNTVSWSLGDSAAGATGTIVVRDGATGVGAIIWQKNVGPLPANGYAHGEYVTALGLPGSATTAMTAEFLAAPSGTGFQSVDISGYLAK